MGEQCIKVSNFCSNDASIISTFERWDEWRNSIRAHGKVSLPTKSKTNKGFIHVHYCNSFILLLPKPKHTKHHSGLTSFPLNYKVTKIHSHHQISPTKQHESFRISRHILTPDFAFYGATSLILKDGCDAWGNDKVVITWPIKECPMTGLVVAALPHPNLDWSTEFRTAMVSKNL